MKKRTIEENGITLIALVVTIIILIILAGVSINLLLGENGIIRVAREQKIIQTKAEILEELELAKTEIMINEEGYTSLDKYLEYIKEPGLNSHKATNIIRKDEANAEITVDGKYIYTAGQVGKDVIIKEVGYIKELAPEIESFEVVEKNTKSIKVSVKARRVEKYEFYIKKDEEEYKKVGEIKTSNTNEYETKEYIYDNLLSLEEGEKYILKVVTTGNKKQVQKEINSSIEVITGNIEFKDTIWDASTHTASMEISTKTEYSIKYQINPTTEDIKNKEKWKDYTEILTNLKLNDEVYVCLSDGMNLGSYASNKVADGIEPKITVSIASNNTTNSISVKVEAKDDESGLEDSPTYKYYIKRVEEDSYKDEATYEGSDTTYTFENLKQKTNYDIKVTTTDKAKNIGEGIQTNQETAEVASLTIDVEEPDKWTNSKTIKITAENSNYSTIRYTTDDTIPTQNTLTTITSGETFTVDTNCTITAIAFDSNNQVGTTATKKVTKIDKVEPTMTTDVYSCLKTDFSKWTLSDGANSSNNEIVLSTLGAYAISEFYTISGKRWWIEGEAYTDTIIEDSNMGGLYNGQLYYDKNYQYIKAPSNGQSANGWGKSIPLNTWINFEYGCRNAPDYGVGNLGFGEGVEYVKVTLATTKTNCLPTTKYRNIKFYTYAETSNYSKIIEVTSSDNNEIKSKKYLEGSKQISDFTNDGIEFDNKIEIMKNGTYTIYIEDVAGNAIIKNIEIKGII